MGREKRGQESQSQKRNVPERMEGLDEEPEEDDAQEISERRGSQRRNETRMNSRTPQTAYSRSQSNIDIDMDEDEGSRDEDEDNRGYGDEEECDVPINFKQLRACIRCKLIKESGQFEKDGCENCNDSMKDNDTDIVT